MKKFIAGFALVVITAGAATVATAQINDILRAERKIEKHVKHDIRDRRDRVYYETRTVWKGNKEYEDTYKITIKHGNYHEKRVSHHRIR
ncbi:MAG: hypothetical protein JO053_09000 [Acidobacteria bacterium]|nr:hypothetical protein [Acidobacteriota bacterium]